MSRTAILLLTFAMLLFALPASVSAQTVHAAVSPAQISQIRNDIAEMEQQAAAVAGVDTGGPVKAISSYVTAFSTFIHQQAIAPTIEYASTSARWIWRGSASAVNAVCGGLKSSMHALSNSVSGVIYWPSDSLDKFVKDLHAGTFNEFSELVRQAGFSIDNVEFGIGIIPDFSIEFTHVRSLTDKETAEVRAQIKEYLARTETGVGYMESVILYNLVNAGTYTGDNDFLNGIVVNLFPLQSAVLEFRLFGREDKRPIKLKETIKLAEKAKTESKVLEERIANIELAIKNLHLSVDELTPAPK